MYKILSLDGGGSWALLQAMALKEIYKDTPAGISTKNILKQFDLAIANSGGSLCLAAMIEYDTMDEVIDNFINKEKRIKAYYKLSFWEKTVIEKIAGLLKIGPRYKANQKLQGFLSLMPKYGNMKLEDIHRQLSEQGVKTHYFITGFDYDRKRATYFRSDYHSLACAYPGESTEITLAHAIHAASNAPINYFDAPAEFMYRGMQRRYWDGAVGGFNNPCLLGVLEAFANGKLKEDIRVLSIGTGTVICPIHEIYKYTDSAYDFLVADRQTPSLQKDIPAMAQSILDDPPDAASYHAHIVLGGCAATGSTPHIVRLNALVQPYLTADFKWTIPPGFAQKFDTLNSRQEGYEVFEDLINLDMDAVEQDDVERIKILGDQWLSDQSKNQPIRSAMYSDFDCQIGYPFFKQGKADWLKLPVV